MPLLQQNNSSQQKIASIEFLRLIFMMIIVLYHFIRELGFYCVGGYAFLFYFILSGFLLTIRFDKSISLWELLLKKIKRFYPLLVLSIALLACFKAYIGPLSILNNLFFNPTLNRLATPVAWYLNILMWICLFYGALIKYFRQEVTRLIIGFISLSSFFILESQTSWLAWKSFETFPALKGGVFIGLLGMGLGYFLAQYFVSLKQSAVNKNYYLYTLLEGVSLSYGVLSLFIESFYLAPIYMALNFVLLIYLFVIRQGAFSQFFDKPFFLFLGKYTLAIYLMHAVVIEIIFDQLKPHWLESLNKFLIIIIVMIISLFVSIIAHYMTQGLSQIKSKYIK